MNKKKSKSDGSLVAGNICQNFKPLWWVVAEKNEKDKNG